MKRVRVWEEGQKHRLHMGFEDPSHARGTDEYHLSEFRRIRDEIKEAFHEFYIENKID